MRKKVTIMIAAICAMGETYKAYADTRPTAYADTNPKEENIVNYGFVKGRVVDTSNQTLPGASIYVEDIQTRTISDANGFYSLPNLKPGTHKVSVTYVGYTPKTMNITVTAGKTKEMNIVLDEGVELREVVVTGAFTGQRKAINSQKNSIGITNVVSADQVSKFPDSNIGDALKRINGINVQYDQGEARFGQVRGTSAELSSVTINGNRLPSAEGGTRNVQLDLIPADMVQTIEVNKVVTSDMDGDAIGGSINLITKNTPYRRIINATAGSGYNWISGKPQYNLGLTYGDRFLDNHLGLMLAASYQYAPGGSDNTEFEYKNVDDKIVLDQAQMRQYYVTRERQSYSASLDYKFNADHKISFKGIYNRRNDWENRYRISYKKLSEKNSKQNIVIQTKAGSDDNKDARLERQQTMDFTLDGEHGFGALTVDWAASYSRATEDRPEERYMGMKLKTPLSSTFLDTGDRQPYSTYSIPSFSEDGWSIDELSNSNQNIAENEWKYRINFTLPLSKGLYGNKLKFGGKYTSKAKELEKHNFDYIDAYEDAYGSEWKQNTFAQIRSGFMPGSQYPIGTSFVDKKYLGTMDFNAMNGVELLEDASGNYKAHENISSAYVRLDQQLGEKLQMVLGMRMEHTSLKYSGFNWVVDEDENETLNATGDHKNNYTNWLPSILAKYNVNDDFKLRASFTKTLSRPKYSALVPCVNYNIADEEATIGNPDLNPTTSYNFDLSGEYYFKSVGLVSLGLFYKDVRDVIVDEVWYGESAQIAATKGKTYKISKTINGYDANLIGVETAYQRDFGFISPWMKCLGLYGTYTYTHSTTKNHKFENRSIADGEKIRMTGSPEHTANASLYFDKSGVNVRLSYNFASSFVDEMGAEANLDRYYDSVSYLDLNASYTWGKKTKYSVYAEANNLLNQPLRYYQGVKNRTMQVEYYGVKVNAGIKLNF